MIEALVKEEKTLVDAELRRLEGESSKRASYSIGLWFIFSAMESERKVSESLNWRFDSPTSEP